METEKCEFCCCRRKWIIRHCPRVQHLILKSSPYLPSVAVMHQEKVKSDPIGLPLTFLINYGSPQTFIQSEVGSVSSWETGKAILGAHASINRSKTGKIHAVRQRLPHTMIPAYSWHPCDGSACLQQNGIIFCSYFHVSNSQHAHALANQMPTREWLHWSVSRTRHKVKRVSQETNNKKTDCRCVNKTEGSELIMVLVYHLPLSTTNIFRYYWL